MSNVFKAPTVRRMVPTKVTTVRIDADLYEQLTALSNKVSTDKVKIKVPALINEAVRFALEHLEE